MTNTPKLATPPSTGRWEWGTPELASQPLCSQCGTNRLLTKVGVNPLPVGMCLPCITLPRQNLGTPRSLETTRRGMCPSANETMRVVSSEYGNRRVHGLLSRSTLRVCGCLLKGRRASLREFVLVRRDVFEGVVKPVRQIEHNLVHTKRHVIHVPASHITCQILQSAPASLLLTE